MNDALPKRYGQLKVMTALTAGVLVLVFLSDAAVFRRFLGTINPLLIFAVTSVVGVASLALLLARGWFVTCKPGNRQGLSRYYALALLFGCSAILIDIRIVFPADMNVPFPASLLFYPAIDLFVQIVFHVLPLTVLLIALGALFRPINQDKLIWIAIAVVASLEPVYHMLDMNAAGHYPFWAVALVGLHVYLINFAELIIFKRYDFIAMYLFRLAFYLVWHIVWGYLRLGILF